MIHAPTTRADLDRYHAEAEPHLKPIIEAVRDMGCGMFFVSQSDTPFRLPRDPKRPAITIIGDDMHEAVGPAGFHLPSVRRVIRSSLAFAVVSSAPTPSVYGTIAALAGLSRRNVMLVETRVDQELEWVRLIQKLAPNRQILLSTVKGGHA